MNEIIRSQLTKHRPESHYVAGMTTEKVRHFAKHDCLGKGLEKIVGTGMFPKVLM
jgi:urease accessory protein